MASNPFANQAMTATGLAQLTGAAGGCFPTTTTTTLGGGYVTTNQYPFPGQILYPTPAPDPYPFPNPYVMNFVGHFRLRKVENGYVIEYVMKEGEPPREYFAEDLKDAGERITALCVGKALQGEQK